MAKVIFERVHGTLINLHIKHRIFNDLRLGETTTVNIKGAHC